MDETVLRALGLAIQIIEEMPEQHRQSSDMHDMRLILEGGSTARDDYLIVQALTLALAWRASTVPPSKNFADMEEADSAVVGVKNRWREFEELFAALAKANPNTVGFLFDQACQQVNRLTTEDSAARK
jgi:hypothetical protein